MMWIEQPIKKFFTSLLIFLLVDIIHFFVTLVFLCYLYFLVTCFDISCLLNSAQYYNVI